MGKIVNYYNTANLKHMSGRISELEKKLKEYLISDDYLSYEFTGVNRDFVFITGYNDIEKELTPFEHPLMLDGLMNKKYIVVDLRKYVRTVTEKPNTIKDVLSNVGYGMFQVNRALIMDMFISEDSYRLQIMQENLAVIFSNIIGTNINAMVRLNPKEKLLVEGVAYIYVLSLFNVDFNKDELKEYVKTLLRKAKLSIPLHVDDITELLNINISASNFMECFDNIKLILKEKAIGLQLKGFYNTMANIWYGPGTFETVLISLDDIATMLALYYTAYNDTSFKKSKLSNNIEVVKRRLDKEAFKKIDLRLKEYGM